MDEIPVEGRLSDIPLPQILHRLWLQKKSGILVVSGGREEKRLCLIKGLLALDRESLDEPRFLKHLGARGLITPARTRRLQSRTVDESEPLVKVLSRQEIPDSALLWRELEAYFLASLAEMFEWADGRFEFLPASSQDFDLLLTGMSTPDMVLEGIRLMTRLKGMEEWLAGAKDPWQAFFPAHLGPAALQPHERYLLNLLSEGRTVEEVLSQSYLSRRDTIKALFALACTGLAGPAAARPHLKTPADFSFTDYDKILVHFKHKASVIFRYVSKEVGPVAMSIMSKALDEVNGWLGPGLPKVTLNPDGCPEVKALLRGHIGLFREEDGKNLFRILDEILAAEVLMVKRTLGHEHEAALVRALER
ncbi:MAG: hypothetical protein A2Y86_06355 [Candidatus Aminicenantes bacterium RBG_13_62_12]|nr:MAG: hypothetical protein A2Y86_06355 [Candidatus Aminicenantes bacterium RBG_13_62_12]